MKDVALPKPAHRGPDGTGSYFDSFTPDQLRTYGEACAKTARVQALEEAAEACEQQTVRWLTIESKNAYATYECKLAIQAIKVDL
jgi:2-keto-3-deoxy-L-rhamnonate aldolase RhmA